MQSWIARDKFIFSSRCGCSRIGDLPPQRLSVVRVWAPLARELLQASVRGTYPHSPSEPRHLVIWFYPSSELSSLNRLVGIAMQSMSSDE